MLNMLKSNMLNTASSDIRCDLVVRSPIREVRVSVPDDESYVFFSFLVLI